MANVARRSSASNERTPLIGHNAAAAAEQEQAEANNSAFFSGIALNPDASSFSRAPGIEEDDEDEETPVPSAVAQAEPPRRADLYVVLTGMWIGTFLAALDGTIVATVLSTIGSEFGKSNEIAWLGTSYLLTQTAFQPLYGRFSDIFGRKAATLFASGIFLVGSLACGFAQTFPQLIAARAFAGIGGGGLTTMSSIVTSDLVSLRERGTYQGLGNVVYAGGAAIGGPLGGWLGDGIGWRWAFLIQVPICAIHFAGCLEGQYPIRARKHGRKDQENRFPRRTQLGQLGLAHLGRTLARRKPVPLERTDRLRLAYRWIRYSGRIHLDREVCCARASSPSTCPLQPDSFVRFPHELVYHNVSIRYYLSSPALLQRGRADLDFLCRSAPYPQRDSRI